MRLSPIHSRRRVGGGLTTSSSHARTCPSIDSILGAFWSTWRFLLFDSDYRLYLLLPLLGRVMIPIPSVYMYRLAFLPEVKYISRLYKYTLYRRSEAEAVFKNADEG